MPFEFEQSDKIPDVVLINPEVFEDERGWFMETYKESAFEKAGISSGFVQSNHSFSEKEGILRGLHYQKHPKEQGKLVRCTRGAIYDIAADIRAGSPTHSEWAGYDLTEQNRRMLWIPPGFAHGFVVREAPCHVQYMVTSEYDPSLEAGIRWDDPRLNIDWPVDRPTLSEKDSNLPYLGSENH